MRILIRTLPLALLGVAAAVLVSCGSSGNGLIPTTNAGPLQRDFEKVAQATASGNGSCASTESALGKTEQDFLELPATIDRGLHARLQLGIANLHKQALAMCGQPAATSTTSTETTPTTTTTTNTETTPTTTPSTPTTTPTSTQTTPTTTTPQSPGGGTEAPGEGSGERGAGAGAGQENGNGAGNGGENAGGASPGGGR